MPFLASAERGSFAATAAVPFLASAERGNGSRAAILGVTKCRVFCRVSGSASLGRCGADTERSEVRSFAAFSAASAAVQRGSLCAATAAHGVSAILGKRGARQRWFSAASAAGQRGSFCRASGNAILGECAARQRWCFCRASGSATRQFLPRQRQCQSWQSNAAVSAAAAAVPFLAVARQQRCFCRVSGSVSLDGGAARQLCGVATPVLA